MRAALRSTRRLVVPVLVALLGVLCARAMATERALDARRASDSARTTDITERPPPQHRLIETAPASERLLRVGPSRSLRRPSDAAAIARDGDTVAIDAGTYRGDSAIWRQNRLWVRSEGGEVILHADGHSAEHKAIWVVKGSDTHIQGITFTGAAVEDLNGAGIRAEGTNLHLVRCRFFGNQMGILSGIDERSEIVIDQSEFFANRVDYPATGKLGHNIYIGNIRRFVLRNSFVHDAQTGHNVKSRAAENYLLYNRIADTHFGSSYLVDLPDGGDAYLVGNVLRQGANTDNPALISYASEHHRERADHQLHLVNNTFVNDARFGIMLFNHSRSPASLINNLTAGPGLMLVGPGTSYNNLSVALSAFVDADVFDFRPSSRSWAIDRGFTPEPAPNGFDLKPRAEYGYPNVATERAPDALLDLGAFERSE